MTDLLIDDKIMIMITKSVIIPAVSGLYRPTGLLFLHQSDSNSGDTAILIFDFEQSKVKVMGEIYGRGHIVQPVSNLCTAFFSFHINRTKHSRDMSNKVFVIERTHQTFPEYWFECTWQTNGINQTTTTQVTDLTLRLPVTSEGPVYWACWVSFSH